MSRVQTCKLSIKFDAIRLGRPLLTYNIFYLFVSFNSDVISSHVTFVKAIKLDAMECSGKTGIGH